MLPGQPSHAFTFGAEHPCEGPFQPRAIEILLGALVRADDPDAALFQLSRIARARFVTAI